MGVGFMEEIIDDNHLIISSYTGPEYYLSILSFVNKDLLEPGCSILLHNKNFIIKPPKGIILYWVPGTGKFDISINKASATFLRVMGSELIQKYLGDGSKLLCKLFRIAEEYAPSIVFIDEIDVIGTKR
ncbi:5541_t:CDS:2, partial [Cetraspora pellucida]